MTHSPSSPGSHLEMEQTLSNSMQGSRARRASKKANHVRKPHLRRPTEWMQDGFLQRSCGKCSQPATGRGSRDHGRDGVCSPTCISLAQLHFTIFGELTVTCPEVSLKLLATNISLNQTLIREWKCDDQHSVSSAVYHSQGPRIYSYPCTSGWSPK